MIDDKTENVDLETVDAEIVTDIAEESAEPVCDIIEEKPAETAEELPSDVTAKKKGRRKRKNDEEDVRVKGGTKIKHRILRMSIIGVCIAVLAMQAFSIISSFTSYEKSYTEQAESLTTSYIQNIQTKIKFLTLELEGVRSNTGMQTVIDEKLLMSARRQKLSEIAQTTMFKDITLADANGDTYSETNIADLEFFQRALSGTNTLSSPMMKRSSNVDEAAEQRMFMAIRYKNVLFEGVLVGSVDPSFMSQGFETISGGNVIVLDADGNVVAGSDLTPVVNAECYKNSENKGYAKLADAMLTGETGTIHYTSNGVEYLAAYSPIELTNGWTIAVSLDYTGVVKKVWVNLLFALFIGLILIVGTAIIGINVADRIARPIRLTAGRLRKLSEGNISEEFNINAPKDETLVLADSLSRTITELSRYINDIKQVLAKIADGDLTAHSEIVYKGDFEAIGISLASITESLNDSISAVKDSVGSIKSGSAQVADGSQILSDTAAREAEAVDGIVSVIDSIKDKADNTAAISSKVLSVTKQASMSAEAGSALMEELSVAMNNINQKSEGISNVIKTIDSIAFQTNILALNASIEAARAGDAGRGFSVVAEEVGNLANMSAEAVKQTSTLINDSVAAIQQGTAIAKRAEDAIGSIVSDVGEVAHHMDSIVEAAIDQKKAAANITESMSKIDEAMHSTTQTAEHSASSSVKLSELAGSLASEVDRFITE